MIFMSNSGLEFAGAIVFRLSPIFSPTHSFCFRSSTKASIFEHTDISRSLYFLTANICSAICLCLLLRLQTKSPQSLNPDANRLLFVLKVAVQISLRKLF
mmetsp:Transcript_50351/g.132276  ORF Transcript_50351/g.132276 Transcript_50351/m.132276 type:complete len:100 (-) Transcript_50351:53-352(-)